MLYTLALLSFTSFFLLLCGKACYSQLHCVGDLLPSDSQRDCCVNQNGLSYSDSGTCRPCVGRLLIVCLIHNRANAIILQFMDSEKLCIMLLRTLDWRLSFL